MATTAKIFIVVVVVVRAISADAEDDDVVAAAARNDRDWNILTIYLSVPLYSTYGFRSLSKDIAVALKWLLFPQYFLIALDVLTVK